mmetsp:Transcript_52976/g.84220  ORF Transcript_52976/g.84220 Transcript_52976/m.84220 type:complete len:113 (-) Transcript_52976:2470-2808(-)
MHMFPQRWHIIVDILNAEFTIGGTTGLTEKFERELRGATARGSARDGVDANGDVATVLDETREGDNDRGLDDNVVVVLMPSGEDCRDDLEGPGVPAICGCDETAVQCGSNGD